MKKYRLVIRPETEDFIRHSHPLLKKKIREALETIQQNPFIGKPLQDPLHGLYSFRVSQYRIVYQVKNRQVLVEVVDIAKREIVYQQVAALVRPFS